MTDCFDASDAHSRGVLLQSLQRVRALIESFPGISQGMLSLTDQAIVSATSFASMVIIGRATSPDELGLYYLFLSIVFIAVGVHEQVVAVPYTVYSKRFEGRDLAKYAGSVWIHHFVLTVVATVALFLTIVGLSLTGAVHMVPGLWVLLAAGPIILLREWVRRFVYANLQIVPAIALDTTVAAVQLGGLLLLWRLQWLNVPTIIAVMGTACAFACLGWFLLSRPTLSFGRNHRSDWKLNWSFGRWALQSFLIGNTTPFIMPWILGLSVSMAAAGVFAASNTLINISYMFLASMDRVLMPRAAQAFARGHCQELRRVLALGALVVLPALAVFCVIVFLAGSSVAEFVYGEQFAGHAPAMTTLAVVMFMNGIAVISGTGLYVIDQPRVSVVSDIASLFVTIAAALILVVPLGALGAALAILAGATTRCIIRSLRLMSVLNHLQATAEVGVLQQGQLAK